MVGIAAMTGLLPNAIPVEHVSTPPAAHHPARTSGEHAPANAAHASAAAGLCADCGTVEAIRSIERKGDASPLGALAGSVVGGVVGNQVGAGNGRTAATVIGAAGGAAAGSEIERNLKRTVTYQVRVRMHDGSHRNVYLAREPNLAVGQRVRVTDGRIRAE
jgi:outer membrane lipoprotein SlyB